MENTKTTVKQKKQKKANPMEKIGKSIKDTFVEMSSSLAGWIDDTGAQFSGKNNAKKSNKDASQTTTKTEIVTISKKPN